MNESDSTINQAASNSSLNKLRAAVLGANDGIVSISAVLMGVAGATSDSQVIFTAGMAALVAGALSMAVGEYVSVSSQSDAEKAYIEKEKVLLAEHPEDQLEDLVQVYVDRGVSPETARLVANELTEKDALKAHLDAEFNLDEDDIVSPGQAAIASLLSFTVGGAIPFAAVLLAPADVRIWATGVAVVIALFITGYFSAHVGGASKPRAIGRVIIGGILAMVITYYVGVLFGGHFA